MGEGFLVRLSAQNQAFLDTWRPTRTPITAGMLGRWIPDLRRAGGTFLRINYIDKSAFAYHFYQGGKNWVPTVPKTIARPGERLRIAAEALTSTIFLENFPMIRLGTRRKRAWTTERIEARIVEESGEPSLRINQTPPVEGVSSYTLRVQQLEGLSFQKSSVFMTIELLDAFSQPTLIQLHHNGHDRAWLSRGLMRASARIRLLSFDGVRLRILYQLGRMVCSTVVYIRKPSMLFQLGKVTDFPRDIETPGLEKKFRIEKVSPMREMEAAMINYGRYYESGRIGAEITYTIVSKALGIDGLILNEPARGGTDLFTRDRKVLVESRFLIETPASRLSEQIALELARITRRIRNDFRWNPNAEVGYIVLSYLAGGRVASLVAEIPGPR